MHEQDIFPTSLIVRAKELDSSRPNYGQSPFRALNLQLSSPAAFSRPTHGGLANGGSGRLGINF